MNLIAHQYLKPSRPLVQRRIEKTPVACWKGAPEYRKPKIQIPTEFQRFCEICATGCGIVECPTCDSLGIVQTKPGGAGVANVVGWSRCKMCKGMGLIPCPMCAGCQAILRPPRDPRQDFPDIKDS